MGLKWQDINHAKAGDDAFVGKRDLLYLECMGWATLANGAIVSYRIVQSVNLEVLSSHGDPSQATGLFVQANVSMGQVFHQQSDGEALKVFMLSQYDPCGPANETVRLGCAADGAGCWLCDDLVCTNCSLRMIEMPWRRSPIRSRVRTECGLQIYPRDRRTAVCPSHDAANRSARDGNMCALLQLSENQHRTHGRGGTGSLLSNDRLCLAFNGHV